MVSSAATISLKLSVTGDNDWESVKGTLEELKVALDALGKGSAAKMPLLKQISDLKAAFKESQATVKAMATEITALKDKEIQTAAATTALIAKTKEQAASQSKVAQEVEETKAAMGASILSLGKMDTATLKAARGDKMLADAKKGLTLSFDPLEGEVNETAAAMDRLAREESDTAKMQDKLQTETKETATAYQTLVTVVEGQRKAAAAASREDAAATAARVKRIGELRRQILAHRADLDAVAKANDKAAQAATKAAQAEQKAIALVANAQERLNNLLKSNPVFAGSRQAAGLRAIAEEMDKLVKSGQKIPVEKVQQFMGAVDKAGGAVERWANDMKGLQGRLTFFEQQMDAILRA